MAPDRHRSVQFESQSAHDGCSEALGELIMPVRPPQWNRTAAADERDQCVHPSASVRPDNRPTKAPQHSPAHHNRRGASSAKHHLQLCGMLAVLIQLHIIALEQLGDLCVPIDRECTNAVVKRLVNHLLRTGTGHPMPRPSNFGCDVCRERERGRKKGCWFKHLPNNYDQCHGNLKFRNQSQSVVGYFNLFRFPDCKDYTASGQTLCLSLNLKF